MLAVARPVVVNAPKTLVGIPDAPNDMLVAIAPPIARAPTVDLSNDCVPNAFAFTELLLTEFALKDVVAHVPNMFVVEELLPILIVVAFFGPIANVGVKLKASSVRVVSFGVSVLA